MNKPVNAWWFSTINKRLQHGDGRLIQVGVTHHVDGTPRICKWGLHASRNIFDALDYATDLVCWRVRLSGIVVEDEDQLAATDRTYLAGGSDIFLILQMLACRCALDVAHLWDAPEIVVQYLKTGDEALRKKAASSAEEPATYICRHTIINRTVYASCMAANAAYMATTNSALTAVNSAITAMDATTPNDCDTRSVTKTKYARWLTTMVYRQFKREGNAHEKF
jgi:hypothetical protein